MTCPDISPARQGKTRRESVKIWQPEVGLKREPVVEAAKLVAVLLRVARVTAGLAEINGSLPPGL